MGSPQTDADARYIQMTQTPIPKLIPRLAVPTIISMLITSFYNMADTFFVSKISTSASGAVGIVFSLMAIIQAIGFTFGVGSGSYISRLLGEHNPERANQAASTAFFSAAACGLVIAVFGLLFIDPFMRLLGATPTILPYARDYARYILIGAPYMAASFVMNNNLRSEGSALLSMIGIAAGAVLNIALDPLFIFTFNMGIAGAALATILSQLVSFFILLSNFTRGRSSISLHIRHFCVRWSMFREILRTGLPTFYRQGLASVAAILLNVFAAPFGDSAIAGMSITTRVIMFLVSVLIGFGQGFQPVAGFNYGAKRYDRLLDAFWFCVKVGTLAFLAIGALGFFFAPQVLAAFIDDPEVIRIGTLAMRLQSATLPFQVWVIISNMMYQSIGYGTQASVLALARQGLFFIPLIMLLPIPLGVLGVQLSQPIADICTFLVALALTGGTLRRLRGMRDQMQTSCA
nr:MATE family efflux transporter [Maliibacterium massiliense]